MKKTEILKKYSYPLCLSCLFVIAFFLRAYRLGELPDVLNADEANVGYNAWSLARYGVDRHLNEWPIYPQNFNSGQSPMYTYCFALLLKILPEARLTPGLVRLPALLSSMMVVICGTKMLSIIFSSKKVVLTGTALMTFCPYFIMSGRYALDCNMMLGASILAITLLLHYLQKPTWPALLWCGAGFASVLYTYALSYLILPIFLTAISLYMLYTKKISFHRLLIWAGEICVLALPLILFVICLLFDLPGFQFLGIHILPIAADRMGDLSRAEFWTVFFDIIKNTLTNSFIMFDAVDKYYTMYVISIPFIAIGFIWTLADFLKSLYKRYFTVGSIFLLYALAVAVTVGFAGEGHIYRANAIFMCYLYFCLVGIRLVLHFLYRYRRAFELTVCAGYLLWTAAFLRYYYTMYSVADTIKYPNSYYFITEESALSFVMENQGEKKVYMDCLSEEYFLFYYLVSPYTEEGTSWSINLSAPPETDSIYMVQKGNQYFITQLQNSGLSYETTEFTYYYVFEIP